MEMDTRQAQAVQTAGTDILVSAAAGSGKTAVLTERIIKNVTDPEHPVQLSKILVVTFTKAAAAELRARIGSALSDAAAKDPRNRYIRKQLLSLESAHISTIHGFCYDIIRNHFRELGLPAKMRIAEAGETKLMSIEVMERVIDLLYETDGEKFNDFAENFTALRDEALSETLLSLYERLESYSDGIGYISSSIEMLDNVAQNGIENSAYEEQITSHFRRFAEYGRSRSHAAAKFLEESEIEDFVMQADTFKDDEGFFASLMSDGIANYKDVCALAEAHVFPRMKPVKKENKTDEYADIEALRNEYKNLLKILVNTYASQNEKEIKKSAEKSADFCRELYHVMSCFESEMTKEKKDRSLLTYGDLEKYAHKLLCEDHQPTAAAHDVSLEFEQIYIDEYQDINEIQDEIFRSIGRENIFIVGDIKQSIYGFRGSAPELFSAYRNDFPDYDDSDRQKRLKVFLTENFRCDRSIIDFSNIVFESLFNHNSGKVAYLPEDRLVCGKKAENDAGKKVTVALVNYADNDERKHCEAAYVACEISKLIASGTKPSDIAVIVRNAKNVIDDYKDEFEKRGIRYETRNKRELLSEPEMLFMTACLRCIDSPESDVNLAAVLKSPLMSFTPDDLAVLAFERERSLYRALQKCAEKEDGLSEKCRNFILWHKKCRRYARSHSSSEIVRYLYSSCSLEAIIKGSSDFPSLAEDDLSEFYDLACNFEKGSFKGLHNFINYLDDMKRRKLTVEGSEDPEQSDKAVKIITAHHSKGLEFKVCFLCDTGRTLKCKDTESALLTDRELGISLTLRDDSGYIRYNTLMKRASELHLTENCFDEEMRVLYVALTRAKEKLYITAKTPDSKKLVRECNFLSNSKCFYAYIKNSSYIEWILSSLGGEKCYEIVHIPSALDSGITVSEESEASETSSLDISDISKYIDFVYPDEAARKLPSKIAVSVLFPGFLDEYEERMSSRMTAFPAFLQEDKKPTGAERGTATHLFMQFCDFENVEKNGVINELSRLVEKRFISSDTAKLVYTEKLSAFFASSLFAGMKSAKNLYREYRFNVKMPAEEFTANESSKEAIRGKELLVQGVIDCFYEKNDRSYVIVDYKTDRAYGDDPESQITKEYALQLGYYKFAVEKLTGKRVSETVIYSFDLSKIIILDL